MAKNKDLYDRGRRYFQDYIRKKNLKEKTIDLMQIELDREDMIWLKLGPLRFYAHDFRKGEFSKERYDRYLEMTKRLEDKPSFGHIIEEGKVQKGLDYIVGWYVTSTF